MELRVYPLCLLNTFLLLIVIGLGGYTQCKKLRLCSGNSLYKPDDDSALVNASKSNHPKLQGDFDFFVRVVQALKAPSPDRVPSFPVTLIA